MISIFSHTSSSFADAIFSRLGKGKQHALLVYKEWFSKGKVEGNDPAFNNASKLLEEIKALTDFSLPPLLQRIDEGETGKFLIGTSEGFEIESVLLPMKAGWTLCLSSQIGCKMGCSFCQTAKMGLIRSLTPAEIVTQLFHARHTLKAAVRNLVFMGMGEPFDNFEAVKEAVDIFTDAHAFNLGPSRITISTSGKVEGIYRFMQEFDAAVHLAVSVNAPNDTVRNALMPVNRQYDMQALKEACHAFCKERRRKILIEYILIQGKTDSLEDATALATYLTGLNCTVNLIPYNPGKRGVMQAPDRETIDSFSLRMKELGYFTSIRGTKGQAIMAACGQLGNATFRKKLLTV